MTSYPVVRGALGAPVARADGASSSEQSCGEQSYGDLYAHAAGCARRLGPGEDVLLLCEDRYWFAVALLGSWQAGRRVTLPPHRGQAVLQELKARHFVIHDGGLLECEHGLDIRAIEPMPAADVSPIDGERELLILYTSGSSGEPVSWVKRARQILSEAAVLAGQLGIEPTDRVLPTVAPQHIYGLLFGVLMPLAAGASFARTTPLHGEAICGCAERMGATWLVSVPAHLQVLVRLLGPVGSSGSSPTRGVQASLCSVVSSGAPLDAGLARRLREAGLEVVDVLGSTETGGIGMRRTGVDALWTPLHGVGVTTDAEQRLVVRSPFLSDSREPHVAGDRARIAEDGRFEHLGRVDGVAKIGGKRVALAELEAEVRSLPSVRDAALLRQQVGGLRGEEIWLAVVAPESSPTQVRAALRERIDPVFVPRKIRVVGALPREENGKLQRQRLLELFASETQPRQLEWYDRAPGSHQASARVLVPASWHRFEGHFPGDPLLPAVSQLHDLVLPLVRSTWPELGALRRAQRLKFLQPLRGGALVTVALERSLAKVAFELRERDQPLARGTLWFEDH